MLEVMLCGGGSTAVGQPARRLDWPACHLRAERRGQAASGTVESFVAPFYFEASPHQGQPAFMRNPSVLSLDKALLRLRGSSAPRAKTPGPITTRR